jgi:dolichol-phosphate mannosyltransferase
MNETEAPDCTIIIPVYFNEGSLEATYRALEEQVFARNEETFETIFVDDGSGDGSLAELLRIKERASSPVKVVKLTRNFGQVSAIQAGMKLARGRCAVVMSADGQDPPELINTMLEAFRDGNEIVIAARGEREEGWFRNTTSRLFYGLMRRLSFGNMPEGGFDFFLLGRRPIDAMNRNEETHPFLQGQVLWTGYKTHFFEYTRRRRAVGRSRWSFGKKVSYLMDGVMSYSFLPIRWLSMLGGGVALSGFVYAAVILVDRLVNGNPVTGWAPLMIVLLIVSGLQLLMLGMIGEYLWRTLAQARNREAYLVDRIYE